MNYKIVFGFLLCLVMTAVLVLAFQTPEQTMALSEFFRGWASQTGYPWSALEFRSDAHLVEYFVVGAAFTFFSIAMKWKPWTAGLMGCCFGLMEETMKIILPTREFGTADLVKDIIGVWAAVILIYGIRKLWSNRREK